MDFSGPGCTEEFKVELKAKFAKIMKEIVTVLGLCRNNFCDLENGLNVTCDAAESTRSKRDLLEWFHVAVSINISSDR